MKFWWFFGLKDFTTHIQGVIIKQYMDSYESTRNSLNVTGVYFSEREPVRPHNFHNYYRFQGVWHILLICSSPSAAQFFT